MGAHLKVWQTSLFEIRIYYAIVFLTFIYMLYKYRKNNFEIMLLCIFYGGFFSFLGKSIYNIYRIILVYYVTNFYVGSKAFRYNPRYNNMYFAFLLFSISFFISAIINNDYFNIIFSQYSKYYISFCLFFIFIKNIDEIYKLEKIIYDVIIVQIFLSCCKYFIMYPTESIVGSIGAQGGALATSFPILGIVFLWKKFDINFSLKTLLLIIGLLFVGFVSIKRALWFITPILLTLIFFYGSYRKVSFKIFSIILILIPFTFYIGVRLNYTLNPEKKTWGSFDLEYVYDYAKKYTFGTNIDSNIAHGRGGATFFILNKIKNFDITKKEFFGYGLRHMYTTSYKDFQDLEFGINSKGAANGAFQNIVSNGFIGMFTFLFFIITIIFSTKNKRLRNILFLIFIWEYFFYTGMIFRSNALALMFIYSVIIDNKKKYKIKG